METGRLTDGTAQRNYGGSEGRYGCERTEETVRIERERERETERQRETERETETETN